MEDAGNNQHESMKVKAQSLGDGMKESSLLMTDFITNAGSVQMTLKNQSIGFFFSASLFSVHPLESSSAEN